MKSTDELIDEIKKDVENLNVFASGYESSTLDYALSKILIKLDQLKNIKLCECD